MGPVTGRTYLTQRWSPWGHPSHVNPDYGRRTMIWVFGALEPATGLVVTQCTSSRRSADFVSFLDQVLQIWPEDELVLIMDNLSIHRSLEVRLWALAFERVRFLFQPTYSPWLNLIEPWWKTLRSLALRGRRFDTADELSTAILSATDYWNAHRHPYHWRKAA